MATALARGFVHQAGLPAEQITAFDVSTAAADGFCSVTGGRILGSNAAVVQQSDVVFLAVKPQQMVGLLSEIAAVVNESQCLVSIAAGVSIPQLLTGLGSQRRIIRVMPNTPALVGQGASALCRGGTATSLDVETVTTLLKAVGVAVEVSEGLLDAVTGLSGSGPAFVYLIIEALSDGGVRMGLPRALATQLAAQTVLGAAQMVLTTGKHPGQLKDAVTSPGGTTIAGLHALEQGGLRGCLMNAVQAATERSSELREKG
jgi:pyrroline-5-carboxylate reductase